MDDSLTIIGPETRQHEGIVAACRHILAEIISHRSQILLTFRRDFTKASQWSRLGSFWNYALPLVPITVYMALMGLRVFPQFDGVNGLVYVAIGVTLWMAYTGLIQRPISTLEGRFRELSMTRFPLSPLR